MPPLPLSLAIYYEGNSDRYFLPTLIERTMKALLSKRERFPIEITEITPLNELISSSRSYLDRILKAARYAENHHIMFIHRDADSRTPENALVRYIRPAIQRINDCPDPVCRGIVPIIPVRCIEAWMLADPEALCAITKTKTSAADLGFPDQPHQVEAEQNPKQKLREAERVLLGSRRRGRQEMAIEELYFRLAEQIDLEKLERIRYYREFRENTEEEMKRQGWIK